MSLNKLFYGFLIVVFGGVSAMCGAIVGASIVYQSLHQAEVSGALSATPTPDEISVTSNEVQTLAVNTTNVETSITSAVQNVGASVVTVVASIPGQRTFFGVTSGSTSTGSGVIISPEGYILTNNHVIDSGRQFQVILADGSQLEGTLVGTDQYSDLAVLKIDGTIPSVASLGDSDTLNPGETVIAIGSPLGDFKNTVTVGVVSATGRSIETDLGYSIDGLIQTDAAINQGNSGGPLVNLAGEVIAINTLVVRGSSTGTVAEGLGFAIPINTARLVSEQLILTGYVSRPYLGINWQPITPQVATFYHLPVEYGTYITDVDSNSPASQAGLQVGDIITGIDETAIDESHAYLNILFQYSAGDTVTLTFLRNARQSQVEVVLGESGS